MNIDERFLKMMAEDQVENPVLLAQANAEVHPRTGRPYQTLGEAAKATATDIGQTIMQGPVAAAKGAAQGWAGLPGDIESIGRVLLDYMDVKVDENTVMPTTEEVKKFLDEHGFKIGTGENAGETFGELAAPGGYVKGAKATGRAVRKATKKITGATE